MKYVLVVVIGVVLSGCTVDATLKTVNKAIEVCEPNEGLRHIRYVVGDNTDMIVCNNGAHFKLRDINYGSSLSVGKK